MLNHFFLFLSIYIYLLVSEALFLNHYTTTAAIERLIEIFLSLSIFFAISALLVSEALSMNPYTTTAGIERINHFFLFLSIYIYFLVSKALFLYHYTTIAGIERLNHFSLFLSFYIFAISALLVPEALSLNPYTTTTGI